MTERYWTARAETLFVRYNSATEFFKDEETLNHYVWSAADDVLHCRDAEAMSALMRLADARTSRATEIRFATAIKSMKMCYYDCAIAAWDDGGRCWNSESDDSNMPDSRTSAEVLKNICETLSRADERDESELTRGLARQSVV
jgi:hypothetical protein